MNENINLYEILGGLSMELLFIAWGFAFGAAITYIIFVLKPYKKDKIKYFIIHRASGTDLIEANFTTKESKTLCSDPYLFLYGLNNTDYHDLPLWGVREVNINTED